MGPLYAIIPVAERVLYDRDKRSFLVRFVVNYESACLRTFVKLAIYQYPEPDQSIFPAPSTPIYHQGTQSTTWYTDAYSRKEYRPLIRTRLDNVRNLLQDLSSGTPFLSLKVYVYFRSLRNAKNIHQYCIVYGPFRLPYKTM